MDEFLAIIKMFAGNFAIRGWALCQGQILSIAQNTALFSILGTTYGGNGQTTFALPDLRGRVPVGWGQGPGLANIDLGEVSGVPSQTLVAGNIPAHAHQVTGAIPMQAAGDGTLTDDANNRYIGPANVFSSSGADLQNMKPLNINLPTTPTGSNQPFSIMQPYLGMNYIICLEGIFPSRN